MIALDPEHTPDPDYPVEPDDTTEYKRTDRVWCIWEVVRDEDEELDFWYEPVPPYGQSYYKILYGHEMDEDDDAAADSWPTVEEIRALTDSEREDLALTILGELNGSDSPMVGPFRRWEDEVTLFAYLNECGIRWDNDQGRFFPVN